MKENLLYGVLGGVIGSLFMGWVYASFSASYLSSCLAVVDLQELVARKSRQLAKAHLEKHLFHPEGQPDPGLVETARIQETANLLKDDLNAFAKAHKVVLLAKQAVVGSDLPDKTAEILAFIEDKREPHP